VPPNKERALLTTVDEIAVEHEDRGVVFAPDLGMTVSGFRSRVRVEG